MENTFFIDSPIGRLWITENGKEITGLSSYHEGQTVGENSPLFQEAAVQLSEYFGGKRTGFVLPLAPSGTPFQIAVWRQLQNIPYGETRSYRQLAAAVGNEKGCRAVGNANGKNPIMILIPCHRVIAANGSLGGFSGGLDKKRFLLALEENRIKE